MKKIEVISLDRVGLVGEISKVLSRVGGNIVSHTANVTSDGTAAISYFSADVELGRDADTEALSRRLRRIRNVRQVRISDI
ncbi:MAG: hypothetical protein IKP78_01290 [Ruminococcus sp.]|nr:hypothetical protein [Ruminococcus sp.]